MSHGFSNVSSQGAFFPLHQTSAISVQTPVRWNACKLAALFHGEIVYIGDARYQLRFEDSLSSDGIDSPKRFNISIRAIDPDGTKIKAAADELRVILGLKKETVEFLHADSLDDSLDVDDQRSKLWLEDSSELRNAFIKYKSNAHLLIPLEFDTTIASLKEITTLKHSLFGVQPQSKDPSTFKIFVKSLTGELQKDAIATLTNTLEKFEIVNSVDGQYVNTAFGQLLDATEVETLREKLKLFESLMNAIIADDTQTIRELVDSGADLSMSFHSFSLVTPITCALAYGNVEAIKTLVALGADINYAPDFDGSTPMHSAVVVPMKNRKEVINALASLGASLDALNHRSETPINLAIQMEEVEAAATLCNLGANITIPDDDGNTPILSAARLRNARLRVDMIRDLATRGASVHTPNEYGNTLVWTAANYGNADAIRTLVEFGASVSTPNNKGETPVWIAAQNGHLEVLQALVDLGADTEISCNGSTPRMIAKNKGHTEIVEFLDSLNKTPTASSGSSPSLRV